MYVPNDNADGFHVITVDTKEISAETILSELKAQGVLPDAVAINDFNMENGFISIDFNQAFADVVCSMGTSGELMIVGSVVNTFLDAFQAESVSFTIDGKILESGHTVYDFALSFFSMDTQSATESDKESSREPRLLGADYADEELLSNSAYPHYRNEDEYTVSVAFRAYDTIRNVTILAMEFHEEGYLPGAELFTVPELTAKLPLVAELSFPGDMSTYGIRFIDQLGATHMYSIYISGKDGSLILGEDLAIYLASIEKLSNDIKTYLEHEATTQSDMNETAKALYDLWDEALNYLWGELESSLSEDDFAKLLDEQLAWIADKEQAVNDAGKEYEGGSIYPLIIHSEAAKITEQRVYQLYALFS